MASYARMKQGICFGEPKHLRIEELYKIILTNKFTQKELAEFWSLCDPISYDQSNQVGSLPRQIPQIGETTFPPSEYLHIKAWGFMLGSSILYIEMEQIAASQQKAPLNSIFSTNKVWATSDEIILDSRRNEIEETVKTLLV